MSDKQILISIIFFFISFLGIITILCISFLILRNENRITGLKFLFESQKQSKIQKFYQEIMHLIQGEDNIIDWSFTHKTITFHTNKNVLATNIDKIKENYPDIKHIFSFEDCLVISFNKDAFIYANLFLHLKLI